MSDPTFGVTDSGGLASDEDICARWYDCTDSAADAMELHDRHVAYTSVSMLLLTAHLRRLSTVAMAIARLISGRTYVHAKDWAPLVFYVICH